MWLWCLWICSIVGICYGAVRPQKPSKVFTQSDDPFILTATVLPDDSKFNPTIANGYLGHALYSETVYINGFYNGKDKHCHRGRIPGTLPYVDGSAIRKLPSNLVVEDIYTLNMRRGVYMQEFEISDEDSGGILYSVTQKFYAHRYLTRVLVTEITISSAPNVTVNLPLKSSHGESSSDIIVVESVDYKNSYKVSCGHAVSPEWSGEVSPTVCFASPIFPNNLIINGTSRHSNVTYTYFSSLSFNKTEVFHFIDITGKQVSDGTLLSSHESEWVKTWHESSIMVNSDSKYYDSTFISGLYYLLSAFPSNSFKKYPYNFFGVSPGGLTNGGKGQDYLGHVFWDQDFWMLPSLLPLFPYAVEHALNYRISRLSAAIEKAKQFGFVGAWYPWESAYTGRDVCPGNEYIHYEQHVTGDIIHMLKQYVYATGNWKMLLNKVPALPKSTPSHHSGWKMIYETARFWQSRVIFNVKKRKYEIFNVMGPDEYYVPINNSAFTNTVAAQNLKFAVEAANVLGIILPEKELFLYIADNMFIPFDEKLNYHPEFEGFVAFKNIVKQADTIMLGFPLMCEISSDTRKSDLQIYSNVTNPNGPAMTWSMFSINYNDIGNKEYADHYFLMQRKNIMPPFQIWSEIAGGDGAVNFLTGVGGYFQSMLYGYLGLRIYKDHFSINPRLLPASDGQVYNMTIHGLKLQGAVFDVLIESTYYNISLSRINTQSTVATLITRESNYILKDTFTTLILPTDVKCNIFVMN